MHCSDVQEKDSAIEFVVGTPGYMAPEIFTDESYDCRVDVFSAGCSLYLMLFEKQLFYLKDERECLNLNKNCPFDETLKKDLRRFNHEFDAGTMELLTLMTKKNPSERPYASELLQHPILKMTEEFTKSINEKEGKSSSPDVKVPASEISKKNTGSIYKKLKGIFSAKNNVKTKQDGLNKKPNAKNSTNTDKSTLDDNKTIYVKCLPKSLDSDSENQGSTQPSSTNSLDILDDSQNSSNKDISEKKSESSD